MLVREGKKKSPFDFHFFWNIQHRKKKKGEPFENWLRIKSFGVLLILDCIYFNHQNPSPHLTNCSSAILQGSFPFSLWFFVLCTDKNKINHLLSTIVPIIFFIRFLDYMLCCVTFFWISVKAVAFRL